VEKPFGAGRGDRRGNFSTGRSALHGEEEQGTPSERKYQRWSVPRVGGENFRKKGLVIGANPGWKRGKKHSYSAKMARITRGGGPAHAKKVVFGSREERVEGGEKENGKHRHCAVTEKELKPSPGPGGGKFSLHIHHAESGLAEPPTCRGQELDQRGTRQAPKLSGNKNGRETHDVILVVVKKKI